MYPSPALAAWQFAVMIIVPVASLAAWLIAVFLAARQPGEHAHQAELPVRDEQDRDGRLAALPERHAPVQPGARLGRGQDELAAELVRAASQVAQAAAPPAVRDAHPVVSDLHAEHPVR
jgi:hypothetical protein